MWPVSLKARVGCGRRGVGNFNTDLLNVIGGKFNSPALCRLSSRPAVGEAGGGRGGGVTEHGSTVVTVDWDRPQLWQCYM